MNIQGWKLRIKTLRQKILKLKLEIGELGRKKEDRQTAVILSRSILKHEKMIRQHRGKIILLRQQRGKK